MLFKNCLREDSTYFKILFYFLKILVDQAILVDQVYICKLESFPRYQKVREKLSVWPEKLLFCEQSLYLLEESFRSLCFVHSQVLDK